MQFKTLSKFVIIFILSFFLSACGSDYLPPVADAGPDVNEPRDTVVNLDGTNSHGQGIWPLTYNWSFISKPESSNAQILESNSKVANFTPDMIGEYTIGLTVNDGYTESTISTKKVIVNKIVIYKNDFADASLGDFIIGEKGTGRVSIENGQLRLAPGVGYLNRAYVSLNTATLSPEYYNQLNKNIAKIIYAFNISNLDGLSNNSFSFRIFSSFDPSDSEGFGFSLIGGGYVRQRMAFSLHALALSPYGPVSSSLVETDNGLGNLPSKGAFKIIFDPANNLWQLYYEVSNEYLNPLHIKTLIGESTNTTFLSDRLPYLVLGSETTGSAFFDNFSVILEF